MSAIAAGEEQDMKKGSDVDFRDHVWKPKFQRFEIRFDLPHIRDVLLDASPIPSTFCLKMRCRTPTKDFADGYPSDEKWHGYINSNDRVLLKVIRYSSPTSAGAECIDSNCSWVEQCTKTILDRHHLQFKNLEKLEQPSLELQVESSNHSRLSWEVADKSRQVRLMRGEELQGLSLEDLQKLEKPFKTGLSRVIKRKGERITKEIADLQKRRNDLMEENERLRRQVQEACRRRNGAAGIWTRW